jgi:hypothetical protein
MGKLLMSAVVAAGLGAAALAMPTTAEARFDKGLTAPEANAAELVQYYYYGYRPRYYYPRRYYAPRYYAPRYYYPRYRYYY